LRRIQAKQCDEPSDKNSIVYFSCLIIGPACSTGAAPSVSQKKKKTHIHPHVDVTCANIADGLTMRSSA